MIETFQNNQEFQDSEIEGLGTLKNEIEFFGRGRKKEEQLGQEKGQQGEKLKRQQESLYKELIENQKSPITHGNKENPEISITFDDGYGSGNIKHILDTLRGSGIKATFFILGDCLKSTPELWKQAAEEGHQICCHTFSHIYLNNNSDTTSLTTGLNKNININKRINDVKTLLGNNYFESIKSRSLELFPNIIKSDVLLETEILMWEAQIKNTLGEGYLQNLKQNYPFFRFPGGCGANRSENIAILKKLGYLSIGWSEDFFRGTNKSRRHMSTDSMKTMDISNGSIPLFHFKSDDYKYIDAYIENMKGKGKTSHEVSHIIK